MGVLPYIQVVNELLILAESHKKTKKLDFRRKNQQILHQQTRGIKQLTQIAKFNYNYSS